MSAPIQFETRAIHEGEPKVPIEGAVTLPIFQTSTYSYEEAHDYDSIRYLRLNNSPNHIALGEKLAALENAEGALVTSSGMAAITTTLLALVGKQEHLLAQDSLYGGTHHFLSEVFPQMGRKVTFFSLEDDNWESHLNPYTKAIYVEAVSNPLLKVPDLLRIATRSRERGLISIIDNTFPSPVNFNPIDIGFDVVVHSATKYLNGHSDIVAGAVMGKQNLVARVLKLLNILGGTLDPHACFLLQRGLKTLALRVRWQNTSALVLAEVLAEHPRVASVIYPGLPSHPDHARAKSLFRGFGGMFCFTIRGAPEDAETVLRGMELAVIAPSLGGPETLVTRPAQTSHLAMSSDERKKAGISESLIRVSVGLEHPDDLCADFLRALEK